MSFRYSIVIIIGSNIKIAFTLMNSIFIIFIDRKASILICCCWLMSQLSHIYLEWNNLECIELVNNSKRGVDSKYWFHIKKAWNINKFTKRTISLALNNQRLLMTMTMTMTVAAVAAAIVRTWNWFIIEIKPRKSRN